jgi:hypothetical protein
MYSNLVQQTVAYFPGSENQQTRQRQRTTPSRSTVAQERWKVRASIFA